MTSKILKLESLLVCWVIVVLEALSHPSTCLKFPPPSFVDQFLLFIPDSNKRTPTRVYWWVFSQDDLTSPSFLVDCCKFVPALGKMAQKGEYFVAFWGKNVENLMNSSYLIGEFLRPFGLLQPKLPLFFLVDCYVFVAASGKMEQQRWVFHDICMKKMQIHWTHLVFDLQKTLHGSNLKWRWR